MYITNSSAQLFQKSKSHLTSLSVRWVKLNKQHNEYLQITSTTLQNLVAHVTWHPKFVHPYAYTEFFRNNLLYCNRTVLRFSFGFVSCCMVLVLLKDIPMLVCIYSFVIFLILGL
jgi:hypothetical protein